MSRLLVAGLLVIVAALTVETVSMLSNSSKAIRSVASSAVNGEIK